MGSGEDIAGVIGIILRGIAGPLVFIGGIVLMFLVVPWARIRALLPVGLVGGLGVAITLIYLMQNVLGIWVFRDVDIVTVAGLPVLLAAAWVPIVIVFSHLLAQYRGVALLLVTLLGFPLGATAIHALLVAMGMLSYTNWNLVLTFLVSLGIHLGITGYLWATGRLENLRGTVRVS